MGITESIHKKTTSLTEALEPKRFFGEAKVLMDVRDELRRARSNHAPMNSSHESYAVILEEVEEFWAEVQKKRENRSHKQMRSELVQIAAMACRAIMDLNL